MVEFLGYVKARKTHYCTRCKMAIIRGDIYWRLHYSDAVDRISWNDPIRWCAKCKDQWEADPESAASEWRNPLAEAPKA